LAYDFGTPFFRKLHLPNNLHVLGTMNRADRSIAILDVAARRRFAFLSLWPSLKVVEEHGCELSQKAFQELVSTFIEHAADETLPLVPGHSYFLGRDEERARTNLRTSLVPLLTEYLAQGYVSGFAEPIRAYLQWLESLCSPSSLPSSRRWAHAGADNKTDARHLPGAPGSHARHEPELRDDRHLKGAIRFTIEKQLRSLETQHEVGTFIHRLTWRSHSCGKSTPSPAADQKSRMSRRGYDARCVPTVSSRASRRLTGLLKREDSPG